MNQKDSLYQAIIAASENLLDSSLPNVSNLANLSALLNEMLDNINWVGFYLNIDNELILGPFQGKVACTRIQMGKGVCGKAALDRKSVVVKDVHQFPGHIVCDSASNSEIVVPIILNDELYAVLDIDAPIINRFDEIDDKYLNEIVGVLVKVLHNY